MIIPPLTSPFLTSDGCRIGSIFIRANSKLPYKEVVKIIDAAKAGGVEVIGIASSTGGPGALATILGALPANFSRPILVVQHITKGFGLSLVSWLNSQIKLPVKLGQHGGKIRD